jgi:tagatose 1,6-diphosphate aldolase
MMLIACDQHGGIRRVLAATPEAQARTGADVLGDTGSDIVDPVARHATPVLVDPVCTLPRTVDSGRLHRRERLTTVAQPRLRELEVVIGRHMSRG